MLRKRLGWGELDACASLVHTRCFTQSRESVHDSHHCCPTIAAVLPCTTSPAYLGLAARDSSHSLEALIFPLPLTIRTRRSNGFIPRCQAERVDSCGSQCCPLQQRRLQRPGQTNFQHAALLQCLVEKIILLRKCAHKLADSFYTCYSPWPGRSMDPGSSFLKHTVQLLQDCRRSQVAV